MKASLSLILLSVLLVSCNSPKVFTDYASDVDFDEYKNFAFYAIENSGLSQLDEDRVYITIQDTLTAKGFKEKLIPDFKVNFYAEVFNRTSNSNFGIGIGGYNGGIGGTVSPQNTKRSIALTVEFADGLTNDLFWQGVVEANFNENLKGKEREEFFRILVGKVLEKYPPEK
ncbi:DUF4136 domain-containing protein [Psychroflexus lacisalsi]|jgi:hypothetical protein|uniref:DUF4136 domain-containing protein n=1 Tax=Psychroflexus lacisalsi TaxID=503928 RepID=A0ABN1K7N0_9FLAO|nr:DUF4136 domain-containing protein [Psychroflexus lacisalsi]MBZ9619520.1 DUF4136 domain-containing protein [Psychroflexus lacisalsi]